MTTNDIRFDTDGPTGPIKLPPTFTWRSRNVHGFANICINCRRPVPARTIHICEAFTDDRKVVSEEPDTEAVEAARHARLVAGDATGFCHCNGFFRGSDHCQCCGCEEFEGECVHVCDGLTCSSQHDQQGRIV